MKKMNLNSDLGESLGAWRMDDDDAMLDIVSSANVACGFHAGDAAGILRTLVRAKERDVIAAIRAVDPDLCQVGLRTVAEAFADRAYRPDGCLVSRRDEGAMLHDAQEMARHVGALLARSGVDIAAFADVDTQAEATA